MVSSGSNFASSSASGRIRKLFGLGADQERADEKRVPGEFGKDADLDPVTLVGAAVEVLREEFFAFGVSDEVGEEIVEVFFRDFFIVVPPDFVFGEFVDDRVFVFGRTAGVVTGFGTERTTGDDVAFLALERVLIERRRLQIPIAGVCKFQCTAFSSEKPNLSAPYALRMPDSFTKLPPDWPPENGGHPSHHFISTNGAANGRNPSFLAARPGKRGPYCPAPAL